MAGEIAGAEVLDAALLASAQAVEHYEMTRYGTLIAWAQRLGKTDVVSYFQQNLDEEKKAEDVRCLVIPHICLTFETFTIYLIFFIRYILLQVVSLEN